MGAALALAWMLVATPAFAREPTWRGRPLSAWIELDLADALSSYPPYGDSPGAMRRWAEILATSTDADVRMAAFGTLLRESASADRRRLLREGLADAELAGSALVHVAMAPREHPELVPEVLRQAADPAAPQASWLADIVEMWCRTGQLDGAGLAAPEEKQVEKWLDMAISRNDSEGYRALDAAGAFVEPVLLRAMGARGTQPVPTAWACLLGARARESPEAAAALLGLLAHPDDETRGEAIGACSRSGGQARGPFVETLLSIAGDPMEDPGVRGAALRGLGNIGLHGERVVPVLARLFDHPDEPLRSAAFSELANWGSLATPHARRVLEHALAASGEEEARAPLGCLERMGRSARHVAPALTVRVLVAEDRDEDWDFAAALAAVLGPDRLARDLLSRHPKRHERAVRAIRTVGESYCMEAPYLPRGMESLAPVIASELSSPDQQHRRDAVELMGRLRGEQWLFAPVTLAGLAHEDARVRAAAVDAARALTGLYWPTLFTWAELVPLLERRSTRAGALAVLAAGAVTCERPAAASLVEVAASGVPAERELAMRALAFHVSAAPDIVVPVVRDAALGTDRALAMLALERVVALACFPAADREALIALLEVAEASQQQQWAATWHEWHGSPEPCRGCPPPP